MPNSGFVPINMDNTDAKSGGQRNSSFQPLPPPPEPPSKLYEDDDFDLYADIEAPNPSKLAPPPEPPAMLFALDDDDEKDEEGGGGGSDEDAGLVIDDRHDAYDPEMPTSPPSPTPSEREAEEEKKQKKKKRKSSIPAPIYPALEDIPPPPSPPPSGCPNQGLYSKMSQEIAKGKRDDSDNSDNDDDLHLLFPRPPTPPFGTLDLSMKLDKSREQTVPEDLSALKNTAIADEDDIDGVPLEDIALPEDEPEIKLDNKVNGDVTIDANDNSTESDPGSAAELISESANIISAPKKPEESSDAVKPKDLSDGEIEEDENEQDEVISHKNSDDETSKMSPKPEAIPLKSTETCKSEVDKVQELLDVLNGTDESEKPLENGKSSSAVSKGSSDERDDLLELEERDGLVDITDEEISNYEKSWEMEENGKKAGLDGLETEAISDNEYPPGESDAAEDQQMTAPEQPENNLEAPERGPIENGRTGEEGEIVADERHPVQWKKLSKTTKERSYRGDKEMSKKEANKEITKKKEKRKELERYDVRKLISEKPRRKVDEFGRDISSHSRSNSRSLSRGRRSGSRGKKRRSRSPSKSKERVRSKERIKERSKSRSKEKRREKSNERSKERRSTSRSKKKRRSRSPKKDRARSREKTTRESKKRKKSPSMSCSSCSCSSCEREKRRSKKLTVIVTNEEVGKRKEKKKKDKKSSPKNRRRSSPVPSKEVFTSGDNILVSVNFKSSKSGESRKESSSKRRKDDENKKKKDKGTKENQPVRSIVASKKSKKKLNTKHMKPVAIIDLDASPFREVLSPKEVIVLTDSDSEDKRPQQENPVPVSITGPKTPPEPLIKFNIVNNKQQSLRTMANPLMDALMEQLEDEGDDVVGNEIPHKGPNTPPEPPVPYDPFEPTKSRSPSPVEAQMDRSSPQEAQQIEQVPQTPPKLPQHVAPKTPSPLHSPPKPADEPADKPKLHPFQPAGDSGDDSPGGGGGGGGDSPYSPGSSEGDDLFEPPIPQPSAAMKTKSRIPPLPANIKQHLPLPKLTSKKRSKSHKDKKSSSKKEIGIKLDEDQLKILDELPNSAVEMQVKDKFLKKLNRQERVVEEVKMVLKPHYAKKHVTKEEYKEILRKAVPKICHSRSGEINPAKIQRLIEAYVKKYRHKSKKRNSVIPPLRQNKGQVPWVPKIKTLWC